MRGTGRTTRQMESVKENAVFIWCNGALGYPKRLARKLNREDLEIVSPSFLLSERWRGRNFSDVIVDHAFRYHYPMSLPANWKYYDALEQIGFYIQRN